MADRTNIGHYKIVKWAAPYTMAPAQDYSPVLCSQGWHPLEEGALLSYLNKLALWLVGDLAI